MPTVSTRPQRHTEGLTQSKWTGKSARGMTEKGEKLRLPACAVMIHLGDLRISDPLIHPIKGLVGEDDRKLTYRKSPRTHTVTSESYYGMHLR